MSYIENQLSPIVTAATEKTDSVVKAKFNFGELKTNTLNIHADDFRLVAELLIKMGDNKDLPSSIVERAFDLNPFQLAGRAEVSSPDSCKERTEGIDSPGADFLDTCARAAKELIEEQASYSDFMDLINEKADGCVPVYNHQRFLVLTDLAAWQEDISDFGDPQDLVTGAGWALYQVAERLIRNLVEEFNV